jgi:hypothetical protein
MPNIGLVSFKIYAQSKLDARLSIVIKDGQWMRSLARSNTLVEIQSNVCLVPIGGHDTL